MADDEGTALQKPESTAENIVEKLQTLPPDEKEKAIGIMIAQSYSGPVMPPQLLRQLEQIIPGGAERVLRLSEKEQQHRHKVVECQISTEQWQVKSSLVIGAIAYFVLIAAILFCASKNYTSVAYALSAMGAFGVISHIIRLPKRDNKTKESKED